MATEAGIRVVPKRRAPPQCRPLVVPSVDVFLVASIHYPILPAHLGGNRPTGDPRGLKGAPYQLQSRSRVLFHPSTACIPLLVPEIKRFLQDIVFDDEAARLMKEEEWWFESEGHLLKW